MKIRFVIFVEVPAPQRWPVLDVQEWPLTRMNEAVKALIRTHGLTKTASGMTNSEGKRVRVELELPGDGDG
jgi:hypothetical protein